MTIERTCADVVRGPSTLPPRTALVENASREEVRAWLELEEERDAESIDHTFPTVPADYVGCISCHCGDARAHSRPVQENPARAAQDRACEEDQPAPGWDFGP